jgi:predicted transcriptional regulator
MLLKNRYFRAAGTIAGVVLEKHLSQVMHSHNLSLRKKHPTINDYNELLKSNQVLDIPTWRYIQRLGDLRNMCTHDKGREPINEEVTELINGVDKIIKTIF